MGKCVVRFCRSITGGYKDDDDLSFHRIPKYNEALRQKWIRAIRHLRGDSKWNPSSETIICSKHFKREDRIIYAKKEGGERRGKTRLRTDAVPMAVGLEPEPEPMELENQFGEEAERKDKNRKILDNPYIMKEKIKRLTEGNEKKDLMIQNMTKKNTRLKARNGKLMNLIKSLNKILRARKQNMKNDSSAGDVK